MPEVEQIEVHAQFATQVIKNTLLANLDAQLQHLRFRFGCNTVLLPESIDNELLPTKRILERIAALHKVAQTLHALKGDGINKPLGD